jgi:hypothetical protein
VRKTVLSIGMIVQAREKNRTTGAAGRRSAKATRKAHAFTDDAIEIRSIRYGVAVRAGIETEVVGDHQDNILRPAPNLQERGHSRREELAAARHALMLTRNCIQSCGILSLRFGA